MMSPEMPSKPADAAQIQLRAAEWIMEQNEAGCWNDDRQGALDAWLSASPTHLLAYWRLKAAWERTHRLAALRSEPLATDRPFQKRSGRQWTFRVTAATAVVAALAGWLLLKPADAPEKIYTTAIGGHKIISLADGSRIELNTATEIRVRPEWRTVELIRGEAYFQIRHDNANPFTVLASGHRVTDIGTKFLVRADNNRLQVTLLDGSVRFESASSGPRMHSEILKPGDVAVATANSVSVTQSPPTALADASAWRRGMLVFRDVTLAHAVAEFNRYNLEQIVVVGPRAPGTKIDGTFRAENVTGFTNMTEHVLDLHVSRNGKRILISG